ncbi:MAG: alpha/beta fold hydrolase [Oscillospiraceae bacterium]
MKNLYLDEIKGKVLFLGDSITDGGQFASFVQTYFDLYLSDTDIEFFNVGVCSETVSGLSEEDHPFPRPCVFGRLSKVLETIKPQWVISLYGINDGIYYPFNEEFFDKFKSGYLRLADTIKEFGAELVVLTPIPFDTISYTGPLADDGLQKYSFMNTYKNYNDVMEKYAMWLKDEMPKHSRLVIDTFTAMTNDRAELRLKNPNAKVGDGIHPDTHGNLIMAKTILTEMFGFDGDDFAKKMTDDHFKLFKMIYNRDMLFHRYYKETIGHENEYKDEFLPLDKLNITAQKANVKIVKYIKRHKKLTDRTEKWKGFKKVVFHFEGNEAIIVLPKNADKNGKWIWRTEFFGAFPDADIAMVKKGYCLVHLAIPNQFGSPHAVAQMGRFYDFIKKEYKLSKKAILFGFSRGGLYAIHYAAKFPQNVSALYLDAPVVDIKSWPYAMGRGCGSDFDKSICLKAFGMNDINEYKPMLDAAINSIANAKIPLIIVAGDSDEVVPYNENGIILEKVWKDANLPFSLTIKKGVGHHPHSLSAPQPIVDFLIENELE